MCSWTSSRSSLSSTSPPWSSYGQGERGDISTKEAGRSSRTGMQDKKGKPHNNRHCGNHIITLCPRRSMRTGRPAPLAQNSFKTPGDTPSYTCRGNELHKLVIHSVKGSFLLLLLNLLPKSFILDTPMPSTVRASQSQPENKPKVPSWAVQGSGEGQEVPADPPYLEQPMA